MALADGFTRVEACRLSDWTPSSKLDSEQQQLSGQARVPLPYTRHIS